MIHLFSDLLAALSIPHTHEVCFHVPLFSSSILGTQRPFQSLKSRPSVMRNFLHLFHWWFLFFWNSIYLYIETSVSPYVVFPVFCICQFTQHSGYVLNCYLSTHTETSFILFLSSKNFVCVCTLDVLFCSGFTVEVSSLYLRTKFRMGIGWLWGRWCQELVNFILSFTVAVANY